MFVRLLSRVVWCLVKKVRISLVCLGARTRLTKVCCLRVTFLVKGTVRFLMTALSVCTGVIRLWVDWVSAECSVLILVDGIVGVLVLDRWWGLCFLVSRCCVVVLLVVWVLVFPVSVLTSLSAKVLLVLTR